MFLKYVLRILPNSCIWSVINLYYFGSSGTIILFTNRVTKLANKITIVIGIRIKISFVKPKDSI